MRTFVAVLVSLVGTFPAYTQYEPQGRRPGPRPASAGVLAHFGVLEGTVQALPVVSRGTEREVTVNLGGTTRTLLLSPYSIRAEDFQMIEVSVMGLQVVPAPPPNTYRGTIRGEADTRIASSIDRDRLGSTLVFAGDQSFGIEPLPHSLALEVNATHLVFRTSSLLGRQTALGLSNLLPTPGGPPQEGVGDLVEAEIGLDADYELYRRFSFNSGTVMAHVDSLMNMVDAIYRRDVWITYRVTQLFIRTSPFYSWLGSDSGYLAGFRNTWQTQHQNIPHDVGHLLSGTTITSTWVAYGNVICTTGRYGFSRPYLPSNIENAGMIAGCLGFNWGATFCSGSSCFLMCQRFGGCGNDLTRFGPQAQSQIIATKNRVTCLTDIPEPPQLSSLQPSTSTAALGTPITLYGSDFFGTNSVTVGGVSAREFTIVSDQEIRFTPPHSQQLGPKDVQVTSAGGTSNTLPLTYVETIPPQLAATPVLTSSNPNFEYEWGGPSGDLWAIAITVNDSLTVPFLGFPVLVNGYPILSGVLANAGTGTLRVPNVPGAFGLVLRSQLVTIAPTTGSFFATGVLQSTWIF